MMTCSMARRDGAVGARAQLEVELRCLRACRAPRVYDDEMLGDAVGATDHRAAVAVGTSGVRQILAHLQEASRHAAATSIDVWLREPAEGDL